MLHDQTGGKLADTRSSTLPFLFSIPSFCRPAERVVKVLTCPEITIKQKQPPEKKRKENFKKRNRQATV